MREEDHYASSCDGQTVLAFSVKSPRIRNQQRLSAKEDITFHVLSFLSIAHNELRSGNCVGVDVVSKGEEIMFAVSKMRMEAGSRETNQPVSAI